jgi:uncharacterized membrane protein YcfT
MKQKLMWIAWPSFIMAGVLELLVFALVDPQDMHWFGHPFEVSRQAAYTLGFFVFWFIISLSGALTLFLSLPANEVNQSPL